MLSLPACSDNEHGRLKACGTLCVSVYFKISGMADYQKFLNATKAETWVLLLMSQMNGHSNVARSNEFLFLLQVIAQLELLQLELLALVLVVGAIRAPRNELKKENMKEHSFSTTWDSTHHVERQKHRKDETIEATKTQKWLSDDFMPYFDLHSLPHEVGDPEHQRKSDVGWMTDIREQMVQAARFVEVWFAQPLAVVINLLDSEKLGQVHEKASEGDDDPEDGVDQYEDPPNWRAYIRGEAPQGPVASDWYPRLYQFLEKELFNLFNRTAERCKAYQ